MSKYVTPADERDEKDEEQSESKIHTRKCVINPNGEFCKSWDLLMVTLLLFTAAVTPFEVAFLVSNGVDALFVINRMVDLGFIADMGVNFFLGYYDAAEARMIWNHNRIVKRYLSGWFSIDLVSILPFDTVSVAMGDSAAGAGLSELKILRVIRLLRLIKLARIFKSVRIFTRIMAQSGLSFSTWALIKFLVGVIVIMHWTACVWGITPTLSDDTNNWLRMTGMVQAGPWAKYVAAFEFAEMAMVMGYGDFTPANTAERLIALILMFICGCIYAYVIGAICGVVSDMDPATREYQQNVDLLNDYMNEIKVPKAMRTRLREYFTHCKTIFRTKYYHEVLDNMSPALQGEVARHSHSSWLYKIPFFMANNEDERDRFVICIALDLVPRAFAPNEMVYREGDVSAAMYIVIRGMCAMLGRVITGGKFFGEDMIMAGRRYADCRALTYLDVYELEKDKLDNIIEEGDFAETEKLIRKQVIRLAMRKKFMEILKLVKLTRGMNKIPKEEYESWKKEMNAKNQVRRKVRSPDGEEMDPSDMETKTVQEAEDPSGTQANEIAAGENELDFWLKGHMTGETRDKQEADNDEFDEGAAVKSLEKRMNTLETQMNDMLTKIKDGFETMEASQEVAFRAFYNAQKKIRGNSRTE